jgi:hypothetical protein
MRILPAIGLLFSQAAMEGYEVTTVDDAISRCNIVVTTTGEWTYASGSRVADGFIGVGFSVPLSIKS